MSHTKLALYGALAAQVGAAGTGLSVDGAPVAGIAAAGVNAVYTFAPSMNTTLVTVCVSSR